MRRRIGLLVVLALVVTGLLTLSYAGRILPGIRVAGIELGGLTASAARALLSESAADASITLLGDGISVRLDAAAGIAPDVEAALADALAVGRAGGVADRGRDLADTLSAGRDVDLRWRVVDPDRFARTIELVAVAFERPVVEGDVQLGETGARVREPRDGITLDRGTLVRAILAARTIVATVDAPLLAAHPLLDAEAIAPAAEAVRNAELPLVLVAGSERVVVGPARLAALVRVAREPDGDGERLVAIVDARAAAALAAEVADAVDGGVRDAVLVPGGERLAVVEGRDGVRVDRTGAATAIADAVLGAERVLDLPAAIEHPGLTTAAAHRTADELALAGAYTTYFPVNAARETNIGAAARTFDGTTVAPGGSFSFWDRLGEVSPRTGYVPAGTIIGGVSSYAIGGGLCQVSTTLFNAVARAGYQIDERRQHSYYIERYPLGLDAAVFAPTADLRWTNDTATSALIRAEGTASSVTFWVYSAPTGRRVELDVRQWDLVWPSPGQAPDPAHAPGYVVPGRDTLAVRTVFEGATVVHRDEWYSHYAPVWGGPG